MTYNYVGEEDWVSQTLELNLDETKACKLILKSGSVYLTEETRCIFGPDLDQSQEKEEEAA